MRVPILQEQGEEFDRRNLLLQLTLGMLSASQRLDALLDRYAPAGSQREPTRDDPQDPLLCFVLGLVSFRNSLHEELEIAAPPETMQGSRVPAAEDGAPERSLRGILR